MKHKHDLVSSYSDLLPEQADPALFKLIHDLDAACTVPEKPAELSWDSVKAQHLHATQRPQPAALLLWLRASRPVPHRFAAVVAALLLMLVLAGVAQATLLPLLINPSMQDPGINAVLQAKDFTPIHQSKTVNGVTITVEEAYADQNRILIGLTTKYPSTENPVPPTSIPGNLKLTPIHPTNVPSRDGKLTTDQGVELSMFNQTSDVATYPKQIEPASVVSYDASKITGDPRVVHLHLSFIYPYICHVPGPPTATDLQRCLNNPANQAAPPIAFDFSVPFHPGKVIALNQSQTSGGKTITLDRVVITRSETRFYIRGLDYTSAHSLAYIEQLSVQGETLVFTEADYSLYDGEGNQVFFAFLYPLADKQGKWTFEIKPGSCSCSKPAVGGPWTFQFTVS